MSINDFDGQIAWRFLLAFFSTLVGVVLIIGIFTAPLGVAVILFGTRPLKQYMLKQQGEIGEKKYEQALQRRTAHKRGRQAGAE